MVFLITPLTFICSLKFLKQYPFAIKKCIQIALIVCLMTFTITTSYSLHTTIES
ncbi:hypothetical protein KP13_04160 (plasmid) [Klebsiella pneumoniae subsp. pneumoniae Kp13]|nr:hypothetical protein KP13_04160 [Klebsiella pneumoniae subsp. pneumoniae Kp13]URH11096.1 hypothetical protein [Klebsiella pneumoniae]